jgi:mono/diheme cytochrome c family protein
MRTGDPARRALTLLAGAMLAAAAAGTAGADTPRERGAYLVNTVAACGNCHTPKDAAAHAIAAQELSGGVEFDIPPAHVVGPNITPDPETGIGRWTEAQIVTALRDGKRPDGAVIGPPMPIEFYRQLSDEDAAAIAVYLKSIRPIRHAVARTQYRIPLPPSYGPPVAHVDAPPRTDKVAYGRYLAGPVGHCMECHTPFAGPGKLDQNRFGAGGREFPVFGQPGAMTVSRNITPDTEHGLGSWTDDQIKRAIIAGIRPDGAKLVRTMPFDWYAKIAPDDLDAIVAYLRSLPPAK